MRLRTYLLIAHAASIIFILVCLLISYVKMYLSLDVAVWLSVITILAGVLSTFIHFFLTRPIEKSIQIITEESKRLADGDFHVSVPNIGPTEFRILANQFNEMSGKLAKSFEQIRSSEASRRELVANVSHDLRTPLASIQSFVEALQDDIIRDEQTFKRYLNTIGLETKRLSSLIDDLFQLSRLESGAESFQPEIQYVDNLILDELKNLTIQLEEKGLNVKVSIPERLPPVSIELLKLKRVLANLLQNAIRHSPRGGQILIQVVEQDHRFIRLTIGDEGEGIEATEQARIFERFYRIDKSRNREKGGAGLGLAIVKSTVELHGGTVGVESKKGVGSRFWFTIPIYRKEI